MTCWQLWRYRAKLGAWEVIRGMHPCRYFEYSTAVHLMGRYRIGDTLLDVGSGFSCFPIVCSLRGMKVIAVDNAPEGLRRLVEMDLRAGRSGCSSVSADAEELPFPDGSFSCCTCISTLEHIPDDRAVVLELARVLTDEGVLILTIPFSPREGYHESSGERAPCGFERVFDWSAVLERVVKPSGLQILSSQAFGEAKPSWVRAYDHAHRYIRYLFFYFEPLLGQVMYEPMTPNDPRVTGLVLALSRKPAEEMADGRGDSVGTSRR